MVMWGKFCPIVPNLIMLLNSFGSGICKFLVILMINLTLVAMYTRGHWEGMSHMPKLTQPNKPNKANGAIFL